MPAETKDGDVYLELPSTKQWTPSEIDDIERFEHDSFALLFVDCRKVCH